MTTPASPMRLGPIARLRAIRWIPVIVALCLSGEATAANRVTGSGTATVTVIRPITLVPSATLSFGRATPTGNSAFGYVTIPAAPPSTRTATSATLLPNVATSPLVITVTGDPGRSYRISVPSSASSSPGNFVVSNFTIWTLTSGNVTTSKVGKFSATGSDTINVGAQLAIPHATGAQSYTAQVPVAISYE